MNREIANINKKKWRLNNSEHNKQKQSEYNKTYKDTIKGRASNLVGNYRAKDKRVFGDNSSTIDREYMINNILNSSCIYCGETDYHKLGCDRIDNAKPHTKDNVVCSCWDCNNKRNTLPYMIYINKIKGEV